MKTMQAIYFLEGKGVTDKKVYWSPSSEKSNAFPAIQNNKTEEKDRGGS